MMKNLLHRLQILLAAACAVLLPGVARADLLYVSNYLGGTITTRRIRRHHDGSHRFRLDD